ncbi:histidinol dehydrogenase [Ornithinibacillus halophilus]|uniref:Histidinol dehydrogenase n=1 Tax=Ornithinibacillus halophilus TaxID=930117 RepID=A0A1M5H135_9BACI|nr:histidinol dehydrogenase [Ornithinibacillus halophilus]SHG09432.1 histidinol dehydrogenase [Ornithinibacillus halophilus]
MKIIAADEFIEKSKPSYSQNLDIDQTVLSIINNVQQNGDEALYSYTKKYDLVQLDNFLVSEKEIDEANDSVDKDFTLALKQAKDNIISYHSNQRETSWFTESTNGTLLGQKITPLDRVGIYVPGGKAAYPSTVLMNGIPALIAGVNEISITTPVNRAGKVNPYVLAAASLLGIKRIYKLGGAQAIAALAYGTETVNKVDKIVGPGNSYVARAKKWVFGDVAIDMIAGPSEICILADEDANPTYIAADLLSQAEHDEEARAICITTSSCLAEKVRNEVYQQLDKLERKEIASSSIENYGRIVLADSLENAFQIINELAPEHLELMIENPTEKLPYIKHAGAIFLGSYSPEPLGDYFAGPNHTLPTSGTAKFSSPLGVYDFVKKSSIIHYSKEALLQASDQIVKLASTEGLTAHANSILVRKEDEDA